MGVWTTPLAQQVMVEGNRFWFYSLVFSVVLGVMEWYEQGGAKGGEKGKKKARVDRRPVVRRLLTDGFDLFIPGSITGWIRTSPAVVGYATVVSTLLASKEIWDRVKDK